MQSTLTQRRRPTTQSTLLQAMAVGTLFTRMSTMKRPAPIQRDFCHAKVGTLSYDMQRANTKTAVEDVQMELNGETQAMMDHVQKKWKEKCYDTSGDQRWEINEDLSCRDSYVWYWTVVWLSVKLLIFLIPILLLNLLALFPAKLYAHAQKAPTDYMERTCCFWLTFYCAYLLHLPNLVLAFVCLMLDYTVYYIAGFLFTTSTCRWSKCWDSHRALDPYRCGPSIFSLGAQADIFVCYAGQTMRHGHVGTAWNVTVMVCAAQPLPAVLTGRPVAVFDHAMAQVLLERQPVGVRS